MLDMLLSRSHNFIFVHIYKAAGTSMVDALLPYALTGPQRLARKLLGGRKQSKVIALSRMVSAKYDPHPFDGHARAREMIDAMGREAFDSYFSFAFVRNPWDWQVSTYKYILRDTGHVDHDIVSRLGDFDAYIRWWADNRVDSQHDFVYSKDDCLLVDYIGRFESIDADFATVCQRIGVEAVLPRLNVSNRKAYQQYYTDHTRELVAHACQRDIQLFEYSFEPAGAASC